MKASTMTVLLAQVLAASALQQYCNGGAALADGNTCEGKGAHSYCCINRQTADFPTFRGACFSPQSIRDREDVDQSCTGGSVYCCD
ncbi:hypothetical protein Cob_v007631 [Colletotrichum orbiculare MAFF 240422]|uniref:Uncharacterized protein n=1 Tax=Colletotrichum orbiculare (strain 104-T / ATCC 96160 / CBS 514.97 / LARS 414 / MAFF 240422) TaxID=1213857 RepID=A0A484FMQ9_COLOR|nr:hypothetical protein Cob_v007631 [Colletotrichum orbiculare MAFF 240422]